MYLGVLEIAFQGMEAAKGKEWQTACPVSEYFYFTTLSGIKTARIVTNLWHLNTPN